MTSVISKSNNEMHVPPTLGTSVNEVLDAFRDVSLNEAGLAVAEAVLVISKKGQQVRFRWLRDGLHVVAVDLGVLTKDGAVATVKATDADYDELEDGLRLGVVQIKYRHRISGVCSVLHQSTGQALPMDAPDTSDRPSMSQGK